MGIGKKPNPPKNVLRCEDPVSGPVLPCTTCWTKDYEKEISVNPVGRYANQYKKDGTLHSYNFGSRKFKIYIPLKAGTDAVVEIRFKVNPSTGVTATDVTDMKTKMENGINTYWNGQFTLEVIDPSCGTKTIPIKFKAVWNDSDYHYTVNLYQTYPREGVDGANVNVSKTTSDWTYAHEFGHCFALPDEYSYTAGVSPADDETVKYYKPDGTLDAAIIAPYNGKLTTAADATIMSAVNNTIVLKRHGWFFAIEAKDLLNEPGLGRVIKCDII